MYNIAHNKNGTRIARKKKNRWILYKTVKKKPLVMDYIKTKRGSCNQDTSQYNFSYQNKHMECDK